MVKDIAVMSRYSAKAEINELFAEELALLKRIQRFGKGQSRKSLDRVERVTLLLIYRI